MFKHRLARMMGRPIWDTLASMPADEYISWVAYDRIEPLGPVDDFWRAALIASTLVNIHRGKRPAVKISDFMPREKPGELDVRTKFESWFGNRVKKGRKRGRQRSRRADPSSEGRQRTAGQRAPADQP